MGASAKHRPCRALPPRRGGFPRMLENPQLSCDSTPLAILTHGGNARFQESQLVAHTLSANKRVRQSAKRRQRNRDRKREIRLETKKLGAALASGDKASAGKEFIELQSTIDRIATRGTIHPNTAARRKSRLARRINALAAAKK